jgi:8-oxo-dGTP pyrophosphatase MutT (NUDIX family)
MSKEPIDGAAMHPKLPTVSQVSAGGVTFRKDKSGYKLVIVSILPHLKWQLPKGIVDRGETLEQAAIREVREEAGIEAIIVDTLPTVKYWYMGNSRGQRVRFQKFVHFFLMTYVTGNVEDHDSEVGEARWVTVEEALDLLAFKSERDAVAEANRLVEAGANQKKY